jgi:hypothetical protein
MKTPTRYIISINGTDSYHAGFLGTDQIYTPHQDCALWFNSQTEAAFWAICNGWTASNSTVVAIDVTERPMDSLRDFRYNPTTPEPTISGC